MKTFNPKFIISTISVVAIYFLINFWVISFDETAFYYNIKSWNLLQSKPSLYSLILLFMASLFFKKTRDFLKLQNNHFPLYISKGIQILTVLLAWYYLFYDFNFYANQWHLFDRLTVLVLAVLSFRFPVITVLFIAQIYVVDYQFNFPLGGSKLLDKIMILEVLKIWSAFFIFHHIHQLFLKKKAVLNTQVFYFIVIMFYSYFYFLPGLQKVLLSNNLS